MPPQLLFDISGIDLTTTRYDTAYIESVNPHRGAIRMLDRIVWESDDLSMHLAVKEVRHDEFWVEGHIPGRPLFPGVLMIEAAAQLASICYAHHLKAHGEPYSFLGFLGVDGVKFRGQVKPGDTLYLLSKRVQLKPRRCICDTQALVNGNLVYEGRITGMPI